MNRFSEIPTWIIVLAFIFMWPVGIVLVILKYSNKQPENYKVVQNINENITIDEKSRKIDKLKNKRSKFKKYMIIQMILAIFFFSGLISDITSGENISTAIMLNMIAFGILTFLCITYYKTNNLIKKIEIYQDLILIRDIYDTQKLATYLKVSKEEVLDFVTYMIREGYLKLDMENDNLVKPKEYIDPAEIFSITCQSCGATNQYIKGKNNKCEYCGNILNLNKI